MAMNAALAPELAALTERVRQAAVRHLERHP